MAADVLGESGGACGRSDGAEPFGLEGADDADLGQAILEGGVEEKLAPAAQCGSVDRGQLFPRQPDLLDVQGQLAAPELDAVEEVAVPGQQVVQPARPFA